MKLNNIARSLVAAACLTAGMAQADTLVYDLTKIASQKANLVDMLMTFQGFDATLGTLTGVTLDIYSDVTASVTLTNNNSSDRLLKVAVPASLTLTTPAATPLTTSATLLTTDLFVGKKVTTPTGSVSGSASSSDALTLHATTSYSGSDLALFTTSGLLSSNLSVTASTGLDVNKVKAVYSNFANGYGQVTYTFTAAPVPEPETYGMLLAGLALVGFVAKRSKRTA